MSAVLIGAGVLVAAITEALSFGAVQAAMRDGVDLGTAEVAFMLVALAGLANALVWIGASLMKPTYR